MYIISGDERLDYFQKKFQNLNVLVLSFINPYKNLDTNYIK